MLCEEECLGDLVNNLHALYDGPSKPIEDSSAVSTGMQTMQILFNKNWIAIKEEQGKFEGNIHSRVKCEADNCSKWKAYTEKELAIKNDTEHHHKTVFFLAKKNSTQQAVKLMPNKERQKDTRIVKSPEPEATDASILSELSIKKAKEQAQDQS